MKIKFGHNIHPLSVSLTYLGVGILTLSIYGVILYYDITESQTLVGIILSQLLLILGIGSFIWGIANLRSRKTGKFPLGDYAVKKILKKMYIPQGLPNPIMVYPSKDGKEIIFEFGIAFPIPLMPIEVRLKYEDLKLAKEEANKIERLVKERSDVNGVKYVKDKNMRLKEVRLIRKDGGEEKIKDVNIERMEEAIFLMGLKPTYLENTKEIYRQITHKKKKENVEKEMERIWKDAMKLKEQ